MVGQSHYEVSLDLPAALVGDDISDVAWTITQKDPKGIDDVVLLDQKGSLSEVSALIHARSLLAFRLLVPCWHIWRKQLYALKMHLYVLIFACC